MLGRGNARNVAFFSCCLSRVERRDDKTLERELRFQTASHGRLRELVGHDGVAPVDPLSLDDCPNV